MKWNQSFRNGLVFICIFLGSILCIAANDAEQDYARAEKFLPWNVAKLIETLRVEPHWIEGGDRFWYRIDSPNTKEFWLVDPGRKTQKPAFDHKKLADSLSQQKGESYQPDRLPFRQISFVGEGEAIQFSFDKKIWVCDLKTYQCRSTPEEPKFAPYELPSPDGQWAAFTKDHNLYVRSLESGEEIQLTADGVLHYDYASMPESNQHAVVIQRTGLRVPPLAIWSPDSKKLVTHKLDQRKVQELHIIQAAPPGGKLRPRHYAYRMPFAGDEEVAQVELLVFDIAHKKQIKLDTRSFPVTFVGPIELKLVWWGNSSNKVYFAPEERGFKRIKLYEADASTGETRAILEEKGDTFVELNVDLYSYNPNVRILGDGAEVIWFSERDGWGHLYLYDGKTGELKNQITKGAWVVRNILRVDGAKRQVYFTAGGREEGRDPYYRHLYRINLDGTDLELLTPEDADHWITFSPSGKYFLDTYSRVDMSPVSVLRTSEGEFHVDFKKTDLSRLLETDWKWPERFSVKARDGKTDIYGIIQFPSNFDPDKKYPLLDDIYPGPQTIRAPKSFPMDPLNFSWFWHGQALAELGFIVINIDGLGTPFRSKAFHDFCYGNLGDGGGIDDHVAGIKQLAERYSWIDLERVGIYGSSSGGYGSARAILTHPEFYKVCVSSVLYAHPEAVVAWWGERYQGYPVGDNYKGHDLMSLAGNLEGKLLIVYGELDENSGPIMALQFVNALIKANKDFDLLVMPNKAHGLGSDPYYTRRRWNYFVKHLLGADIPSGYKISSPSFR